MKIEYKLWIIIILLIIASNVPLFALDYTTIRYLIREDSFYENSQAIFYLSSSILMLIVFIQNKPEDEDYFVKSNKNYFFLLLFIFYFLCFGEEISWGQRIFGITTPEYWQKFNAQKELNIHNLWIFEGLDKKYNFKTGLEVWITSSRLLAMFWALYYVTIPILNYSSLGIKAIIKKINLPLIPLWISSLFILTYIITSISRKIWHFTDIQPVNEVAELCFAFLFLVASISLFLKYKRSPSYV